MKIDDKINSENYKLQIINREIKNTLWQQPVNY